jgi:hypothetical protein
MQELIAKMKLNIEQKNNHHPQSTKVINNNHKNHNGYVNSTSNHQLSSFGYGSSGSSIGSSNGYHQQQPKLPINSSTTASYHLNYSKLLNHTGLTNSTPI